MYNLEAIFFLEKESLLSLIKEIAKSCAQRSRDYRYDNRLQTLLYISKMTSARSFILPS